jgi:hypothetical protein
MNEMAALLCVKFHYDMINDLPWNINISLMYFHPKSIHEISSMKICDKVIY